MSDLPELGDVPADSIAADKLKHLAYAEAAVMLLECLMLKLIETRLFTSAQIIGAVEDVIATKRQMMLDGEHPQISAVALGQLRIMANSLAASDRAAAHDHSTPA